VLRTDVIEEVADGLPDETECDSFIDKLDKELGSDEWGEFNGDIGFLIAEGDGGEEDDWNIREGGPPRLVLVTAVSPGVTPRTRNGDRAGRDGAHAYSCSDMTNT
jgi:hypothetical protein